MVCLFECPAINHYFEFRKKLTFINIGKRAREVLYPIDIYWIGFFNSVEEIIAYEASLP